MQKLIDIVTEAMLRGMSVRLTVDKSFFWDHMEIEVIKPGGLREDEEIITAGDESPPPPPMPQPDPKAVIMAIPAPIIEDRHLREFQ